jgi:hypothetical protein
MAHNEYLGSTALCGLLVELQRPVIEPMGSALFVIMETEPNVLELADLGVVLAPSQIDDVGYPQGLKLLGLAPGRYRATECQPLVNEKDLHLNRLPPSDRKIP